MTPQPKTLTLYQLFSILSLDVVAEAVIGSAFVSQLCGVHPDGWFYLIMALSVWIIYTTDHLIDAWRLKQKSHTLRHRFHYRNFSLLVSLGIILSLIDFLLVLTKLHPRIITGGLIVLAMSAAYFGALNLLKTRRGRLLHKELIVAFVYTAGIWVGPTALRGTPLTFHETLLMSLFFMLVWSVLLLYSAIEVEVDRLDDHRTMATRYGVRVCHHVIHLLLFLLFGLNLYLVATSSIEMVRNAAMLFMLMASVILIMDGFPSLFRINYRYHHIGELIFWLPLLLIV